MLPIFAACKFSPLHFALALLKLVLEKYQCLGVVKWVKEHPV